MTPPLGWYGRKKYGRFRWAQTPPPLPGFGHFDDKSLNVQNHVLRKFGSIKKILEILVGCLVGDPIVSLF